MLQGILETHAVTAADQLSVGGQELGVDEGDVLRQRERGVQQCLGCHHLAHQSPVQGRGGIDKAACEGQLLGPGQADNTREFLGQAPARHDAHQGVGIGKAGAVRCHQDVAGQRHLETTGDRHPVDGAHHWLAAATDGIDRIHARIRIGRFLADVALATQLLEIEPGRKGLLAGTGQHHGLDCLVGLDGLHHIVELAAQGAAQSVHGRRTIEGHDGDTAVADIEEDEVFGCGFSTHGDIPVAWEVNGAAHNNAPGPVAHLRSREQP